MTITLLITNVLRGTLALFEVVEVIWGLINIVPLVVGTITGIGVSGNPHSADLTSATAVVYVLIFLQWFAIGYLLSNPIYRRFAGRRDPAAP